MSDPLTSTMLANEALAILSADGGTGQDPDTEDTQFVISRIEPLVEELAARNVVTVSDIDDISPPYFSALAELLANDCAPKFGQSKNPALREDAEGRLKIMSRAGPSYTLKTDRLMRRGSRLIGR